MSLQRKNIATKRRRCLRVRKRLRFSSLEKVSVFRSAKHIYAQALDKDGSKTLASCSSLVLKDVVGDKKEVAKKVGINLANKLSELGITKVCFDRGGFRYHGRVRSLADGLRAGGVNV